MQKIVTGKVPLPNCAWTEMNDISQRQRRRREGEREDKRREEEKQQKCTIITRHGLLYNILKNQTNVQQSKKLRRTNNSTAKSS